MAPKVCIVGAGVAGLRCADVMLRGGMDVTILEARDRIGGRCHQSSALGPLVDLGCNQIHGTDHNPMAGFARETGTITHQFEPIHSIVLKDGKYLCGEVAKGLYADVESLYDNAYDVSRNNWPHVSGDLNLLQWFKDETNKLQVSPLHKERMIALAHNYGDFCGEAIETQSLRDCWLGSNLPGDNLFVAGTYINILGRIAQPALRSAKVLLRHEVNLIENIEDRVKVETTNGFSEVFDQVVVTVPHGWLKRNKSVFIPSLPRQISMAIDTIGYGRLEKVFIHFPRAWWETDVDGLGKPGKFASETMFPEPEYAPETNPARWSLEIFSYSAVPDIASHPTLLFYIHGDCSQHVTSSIQGLSQKSPEYYTALVSFFEPYYSRLPNYSSTSAECQPLACLSTDWEHDRLAGYGAYTNFTTGPNDGAAAVETMRTGMGIERHVWFAGEHAAPDVALGTLVGAYWSGEAVAKRIRAEYGL